MSLVVDLNRERRSRRAEEEHDCRLWTVEDALVDLLETIRELPEEERPTQMHCVCQRPVNQAEIDNGASPTETLLWDRSAGITANDGIVMMEREKFKMLLRGELGDYDGDEG